MTYDLYLLSAVFTKLVVESREPAGKTMAFDEGLPAGRTVRILVPVTVHISRIRVFQAEFLCLVARGVTPRSSIL